MTDVIPTPVPPRIPVAGGGTFPVRRIYCVGRNFADHAREMGAAVPAADDDFAYISSGTWSLLGAEIQKPLCEEGVMKANYTNEGGVDGSIRLLKNIMGLWIIVECLREWVRRCVAVCFAEMVEMAV